MLLDIILDLQSINLFNPILFRIIIYIWTNLLGNLMSYIHKNHLSEIKME
jgi:hypothetical protein